MKISVCIDMMFAHLDFADRFAAVRSCGISTVEFWKWSNKNLPLVQEKLKENDLSLSIFNIDCQDEKLSYDLSRGILNAGRKDEFLTALRESIPVYHTLNASGMIVLVGETIPTLSREEQMENIYTCLQAAEPIARAEGITLLMEPLNATDRKNYFLPESAPAFEILDRIDSPNVKLLFDIYHQQMTEGHLLESIGNHIDRIGHFHVADCPGRHEPGTGELNYPAIIRAIDHLPYSGHIGLEYRATKPDNETFGFLREV